MRTLMWVALLLDQLFLLVVGSADLDRYQLTNFQVKEKYGGASDANSKLMRHLHKNLPYVRRQQQLELLVVFTIGVALWIYLAGTFALGVVWALLVVLVITVLRRSALVRGYAYQLFEKMLDVILKVALGLKPLWWLVGLPSNSGPAPPASKSELIDTVQHASTLNSEEKTRISRVLELEEKSAHHIMTAAKKIKHVTPGATLGPVLLSDLEKSGHGYFPVVDKSDGVVGLLNLKQVADIMSAKVHTKVADIMSEEVVWVPEDMPILEVARMFLSAKQYVLLVQNSELEFSGMITIADLLDHTLGVS